MKLDLIFSSEHETNHIPDEYLHLFGAQISILDTHRGWDIGIPVVVEFFEDYFKLRALKAKYSRLLVDLNRSLGHKNLFSEYTSNLSLPELDGLLANCYYPHRNELESRVVQSAYSNNLVVHIAFHSFTPVMNGMTRNTSIGILYDPRYKLEGEFSRRWKSNYISMKSKYKIRSNYPYLGISDSLPTYLRKKYYNSYIGIELELNQDLFSEDGKKINDKSILANLADSLKKTLSI